jgi:hypothetical protein
MLTPRNFALCECAGLYKRTFAHYYLCAAHNKPHIQGGL